MEKDTRDSPRRSLMATYGEHRFGDRVMRERLPWSVYEELKRVQAGRLELAPQTAETVANAMKDWAIEHGATHYTHWFQPLTGKTAEKHDAFIRPNPDGGTLMEFSGRELVKGESDASSFPSGGLRATFEARGYTAWDTTSPAFLKEDPEGVTLYIPTAFISYNGEALDKKVPLLRSIDALNAQALRVLRLLGNSSSERVWPSVGPEQEYFLVEKELHDRRPDLRFCGRTLMGIASPKGQELEDHYYGQLPERVTMFMRELNRELWRLGVSAKTQHKEVAPNQFEIATVYSAANVAADDNQLVMETLSKVAGRHGLVALLHEKPFAGVNGSGKHINWSLATDDGLNLLEPGDEPASNWPFLTFLAAVIEAVDLYAPLLRAAVASAGNDLRLGANEAPPAIVSIFLGDELVGLLEQAVCDGERASRCGDSVVMGHTALPRLPRDISDRNRTSPFAFTGNKFEFRMAPSGESISTPVAVLNAAVADALSGMADVLEAARAEGKAPKSVLSGLLAGIWTRHKRVVFNGNGYGQTWRDEAATRGLPNLPDSVAAFAAWSDPACVAMLSRTDVLSGVEVEAMRHIEYERYAKRVQIDAATMIRMTARQAIPAAEAAFSRLAKTASLARTVSRGAVGAGSRLDARAAALLDAIDAADEALRSLRARAAALASLPEGPSRAAACRDALLPAMAALRERVDALEAIVPRKDWPFPGYERLLFEI